MKLLESIIRLGFGIMSFYIMFMGSFIIMLGLGIMNLMLTILSFDELFIESPFNQTSIGFIEQGMREGLYLSAGMFMGGVIIIVVSLGLFVFAITMRLKKREDGKIIVSSNRR